LAIKHGAAPLNAKGERGANTPVQALLRRKLSQQRESFGTGMAHLSPTTTTLDAGSGPMEM